MEVLFGELLFIVAELPQVKVYIYFDYSIFIFDIKMQLIWFSHQH